MSQHRQIQKQQSLREAEGYLELLLLTSHLRPSAEARDPLARRTLAVLDRVGEYGIWRAHACYLRGQAFRMMERYSEAIGPLRQAAEIDRLNVHIWLALAWCYKRCGRIDLAIESLEEALQVDSHHAIIHYNLACYWSLAKNVRHSVGYLAQAFELDPNYRDRVGSEVDFDPIREFPQFQALATVIV